MTPGHLVNFGWDFDNSGGAPAGGFRTLTFPITVHAQQPWTRGYYHAQDWGWVNKGWYPLGYTGVQPRPEGHAYVPFSVFGDKAGDEPCEVVDEEYCHQGADGDPGVTCNHKPKIPNFVFGREYLYTVEQDAEDERLWRGWVTDAVTHEYAYTGAWRVPEGCGRLKGKHVGFVEYYTRVASCAELPYAKVTFGRPYCAETGQVGQFGTPYKINNKPCTNKAGLTWSFEPNGDLTIEVGFKKRHRPDPPVPEPCPCVPDVDVEVNVHVNGREVAAR